MREPAAMQHAIETIVAAAIAQGGSVNIGNPEHRKFVCQLIKEVGQALTEADMQAFEAQRSIR